jgi:adenosine deaminase
MLQRDLSISFCTDNRLVSNTTVCNELQLAVEHFPIDSTRLKSIVINGFERSFYYQPYAAKKAYLQKAIAYYDTIARQFGIAA